MNRNLILTIFSTLFAISWSTNLLAVPDVASAGADAVVLLSNSRESGCATGFIASEDTLLTNAHVVELLCSGLDCSGIEAKRAYSVGELPAEALPNANFVVDRISWTFDVAYLRARSKVDWLRKPSYPPSSVPKPNQKISVLGFPGCTELEESSGLVTELSPLDLTLSALGAHGSSGSPILNEQGELVGLVNQAASLGGALRSSLFGASFYLRGTRLDLPLLNGHPTPGDLGDAVDLLNGYYQNTVSEAQSFKRLRLGLTFYYAVDGLRRDLATWPDALAPKNPLLLLGDHIDYLNLPANNFSTPLEQKLLTLVTASNLELHGPFRSHLDRFGISSTENNSSSADVKTLLEIPAIQTLVEHALNDRFPGLELSIVSLGILLLLLILPILYLWAASCGYVFARANGSRLRRALIGGLVGMALWPISFFVFIWLQKRRRAA